MAYFNRFDICEAWWVYANSHHGGQGSKEYRILGVLQSIGFSPGMGVQNRGYSELQENAQAIYRKLALSRGTKVRSR